MFKLTQDVGSPVPPESLQIRMWRKSLRYACIKSYESSGESEQLTIKHGLREAIQQWIATQIPLEEDPLFKVKPVQTGVKTDPSDLDRAPCRGVLHV